MDNTSTFKNTMPWGLMISLCYCRMSTFRYVSGELNICCGWCYYIHVVCNISIKTKVSKIPSHLKILVPLCCHKNQSPCSLVVSVLSIFILWQLTCIQCSVWLLFRVKMFFLDQSCWLNSELIVVLRWHDSWRMLICNSFKFLCFVMYRN